MLDGTQPPTADCAITILHAHGRRLAKLVRADGSTTGYDAALRFDAIEIGVRDLDHLAAIVRSLLPCWDRCVVRGSLVGGSPATGIRRLLHADRETGDPPTLYELPRRWIGIDIDGIPRPPEIPAADIAGCARVAVSHLPVEFRGAACVAVASGSHGFKPGSIRLRIWFWLDGAATYAVLREWFFDVPGVDLSTFRPVQCCYTAAPILADGVADPAPDRVAVLPGAPVVAVRPLLPPPQPRQTTAAPRRAGQAGQAGQAGRPAPPPGGYRADRADRYRSAALAGIEARLLRASEGERHHALVVAATRMFELGSLSNGYISRFIGDAARALNAKRTRQIDDDEVADIIDWARSRATPASSGGRQAA